jgi:hypothetical protein
LRTSTALNLRHPGIERLGAVRVERQRIEGTEQILAGLLVERPR